MSKNNPGDNNGTTDGIIKIQQPNKLHGLHQALFIMKCLSKGENILTRLLTNLKEMSS
jgi:hypothetical protein